jgi:hypothetical protein
MDGEKLKKTPGARKKPLPEIVEKYKKEFPEQFTRATFVGSIVQILSEKGCAVRMLSGDELEYKGETVRFGSTIYEDGQTGITKAGRSIKVQDLQKKWFFEAFEELYMKANPSGDFIDAMNSTTIAMPWDDTFPIEIVFENPLDEKQRSVLSSMTRDLSVEFASEMPSALNHAIGSLFARRFGERLGELDRLFSVDSPHSFALRPKSREAFMEIINNGKKYQEALHIIKKAAADLLGEWKNNPDPIKKEIGKLIE